MDRGALWTTVHRVEKSWTHTQKEKSRTRLTSFSMHTHWAAMGECDGDLTFTVVIREDLSEEVAFAPKPER